MIGGVIIGLKIVLKICGELNFVASRIRSIAKNLPPPVIFMGDMFGHVSSTTLKLLIIRGFMIVLSMVVQHKNNSKMLTRKI